jgi:hypothetical protein
MKRYKYKIFQHFSIYGLEFSFYILASMFPLVINFLFSCCKLFSNMADTDSVFEFLHMQIVEYIHEVHGKESEVQNWARIYSWLVERILAILLFAVFN